jgi:hypothetical protein
MTEHTHEAQQRRNGPWTPASIGDDGKVRNEAGREITCIAVRPIDPIEEKPAPKKAATPKNSKAK